METVVVTGATSMLGIALIEHAVKEEETKKIFAIVQPKTKKLHRIPRNDKISIIECDAHHYSKLNEIIHCECDVFYHISWIATGTLRNSDILLQAENVKCSIEAIRVANKLKCKKFIGTGSQAEYGVLDVDKISPFSPTNPVQPYGITKYAAGKLLLEEAKLLQMDAFWVRVFSVYGKYDKETTMIASTIKKMLNRQQTSYTSAVQKWDYLFSGDAGRALYMIGEKSSGRKVYCLGSGVSKPLYEYINELKNIFSYELDLGIGQKENPSDVIMNLCADITELTKDTGWTPQTTFADGVRYTVEHVKCEQLYRMEKNEKN